MASRDKIIQVARNYIGIKYVPRGQSPIFGLGCWGFFSRVCHDLGLQASYISEKRYNNLLRSVLQSLHAMKFIRTESPKFGDVIVRINNTEVAGHTGIITDIHKVIHATKDGIQETKIEGQWTGFNFPGVE